MCHSLTHASFPEGLWRGQRVAVKIVTALVEASDAESCPPSPPRWSPTPAELASKRGVWAATGDHADNNQLAAMQATPTQHSRGRSAVPIAASLGMGMHALVIAEREARLAMTLRHPNIVATLAAYRSAGSSMLAYAGRSGGVSRQHLSFSHPPASDDRCGMFGPGSGRAAGMWDAYGSKAPRSCLLSPATSLQAPYGGPPSSCLKQAFSSSKQASVW